MRRIDINMTWQLHRQRRREAALVQNWRWRSKHTRRCTRAEQTPSADAMLKTRQEELLRLSWKAALPELLCADPNENDDVTAAGTRARPFRTTDAALEQFQSTREWKARDERESLGFAIQDSHLGADAWCCLGHQISKGPGVESRHLYSFPSRNHGLRAPCSGTHVPSMLRGRLQRKGLFPSWQLMDRRQQDRR